jgi:predicted TIM-barrel fold metal-dependent hydrolase
MALPVLWDPELCAAEIRRVAEKGCHSVTFTENPAALDQPSFHDEHWDPMWEALVDVGTILNIHLGSSGKLAVTAPDAPMDVMITLQPMNICAAAADLVWSRVFKQYPALKVALSEGGTGWIPYFLDRLDRTYEMHHLWTGQDFGDRTPSDVFRDHILTCFIADPVGLALREEIGIDNICWEQDYPHSDSSWPEAPEELNAVAQRYDVSDADLNKITYENAMRWYRFDPFAIRPKEQCTVGALRAEAAGHDVSVRSMNKRNLQPLDISLGELAANASA